MIFAVLLLASTAAFASRAQEAALPRTSSTVSQSSSDILNERLSLSPALLMRMSILPKRSFDLERGLNLPASRRTLSRSSAPAASMASTVFRPASSVRSRRQRWARRAILIASCGTYTSYRQRLRSLPDYRAYPYFHLFSHMSTYTGLTFLQPKAIILK